MLNNNKIPIKITGRLGQCHFEAPFPLVVMPGQKLDKKPSHLVYLVAGIEYFDMFLSELYTLCCLRIKG